MVAPSALGQDQLVSLARRGEEAVCNCQADFSLWRRARLRYLMATLRHPERPRKPAAIALAHWCTPAAGQLPRQRWIPSRRRALSSLRCPRRRWLMVTPQVCGMAPLATAAWMVPRPTDHARSRCSRRPTPPWTAFQACYAGATMPMPRLLPPKMGRRPWMRLCRPRWENGPRATAPALPATLHLKVLLQAASCGWVAADTAIAAAASSAALTPKAGCWLGVDQALFPSKTSSRR